jgi:hypothetical protein
MRETAGGGSQVHLPRPAAANGRSERERWVRITTDLTPEEHKQLRLWLVHAETDAQALVRALLQLLQEDPGLAGRAEERAHELRSALRR